MSPSSPVTKIADTGQLRAASTTSSTGAPSGSTTTALSSSSSWKTSGAVSTQSPEPMQSPRSTSTWMRLRGESSGTWPRLSAPEARLEPRAGQVQTQMHMVAMRERLIHVLAALAVPVVTDGVGLHALASRPPRVAVPDDLLDAHAPCQRVRVAQAVRRQQQLDERIRGRAVGRRVDIEVPVHRAALGVEAVVVL